MLGLDHAVLLSSNAMRKMSLTRFTNGSFDEHRTGSIRLSVIVLLTLCLIGLSSVAAYAEEEKEASHDANIAVTTERVSETGDATLGPDLLRYEKSIKPLFEQACFDCHSGDSVEGNFRADLLDPNLVGGQDLDSWLEVYAVLSKGEMPPPDESDLTDEDRAHMVDWLSNEIHTAEKLRKASGNHSSFRRLTRYEYNYALQDLLGVPWTFADDLPAEASEEDAFENNADSLHMSVKQVETYHQLALKALQRITVRGERPPEMYWSIPMKAAFDREEELHENKVRSTRKKFEDMPEKQAEQLERLNKDFRGSAGRSHYLELETGRRAALDWEYRGAKYSFSPSDTFEPMPEPGSHLAVVQPGGRQAIIVELGDRLPNEGTMRVRIRASRADGVEQLIPSLQLSFGFRATDQGASVKRLGQQDIQIEAPYGKPKIYEWHIPLSEIEHRNTYRGEKELGEQPNPSEYIRFTNSTINHDEAGAESPAILIEYVEVTAPVYEEWPPQSHRSVFIESENAKDETAYAREIIANFMARAWRRPPSNRDIDRKLKLFQTLRPSSLDFQDAIVEVLATVLTSPKFLYVSAGVQQTAESQVEDQWSQNELATRLSLFLWCSLPDETLLELASSGRLNDPEVLTQQVNRMLADPRASRFNQHFVGQWLKMQPLEFLNPTKGDDGLDEVLLEAMKREPIALFADMLDRDSSVLEFIDSDYLVVNERLAEHYGIADVQGNRFRRVSLPANPNRGGLLTQAGLLAMNSNGEDSHPVKRGVWLLTNLLNDPPPPPPAAVPEIDLSDPEIAKMTLKERIEDHRNKAACLSCHQKIDPWGIVFENYDARGRWRDQIDEKVIDATSVLPNEVRLDGISGLKEYLVEDRPEQFVMATVEKMASFALGRQLAFSDRAAINEITERVRASGDGIKTMVISVVTSELFRAEQQ